MTVKHKTFWCLLLLSATKCKPATVWMFENLNFCRRFSKISISVGNFQKFQFLHAIFENFNFFRRFQFLWEIFEKFYFYGKFQFLWLIIILTTLTKDVNSKQNILSQILTANKIFWRLPFTKYHSNTKIVK